MVRKLFQVRTDMVNLRFELGTNGWRQTEKDFIELA